MSCFTCLLSWTFLNNLYLYSAPLPYWLVDTHNTGAPPHLHLMNKLNKKPLTRLQSLKMSSVSSVQVTKKSSNLQPYVRLKRLNLQSAVSFRIPSVSINKCFYNGPKVLLSPIKSAIQRVSFISKRSVYRRRRVYPIIKKCDAKRCICCRNLSCNSTITSTVNGRTFNVKINSDVDCTTTNIIYVLT